MNQYITPPHTSTNHDEETNVDVAASDPTPKRSKLLLYIEFLSNICAIMMPLAFMDLHLHGSLQLFQNFAISLLISLPFLFLRNNCRPLILIPVWLITIFILTNLWYFRFCRDFIPLSNYFLFDNFNSDLFGAGAAMIKPKDIVVAMPAILITLAYVFRLFKKSRHEFFSKRTKTITISLACILFTSSEISNASAAIKQEGALYNTISQTITHRYNPLRPRLSYLVDYNSSGFVGYMLRNTLSAIAKSFIPRRLTNNDLTLLNKYDFIHSQLSHSTPDMTGIFKANKDKNLIFIVVESLNSWAVDREINGHKVMPYLSALLKEKGTIGTTEMVTQVNNGVSSDGQFIYNTGMYAASDETTVNFYLDNDFRSLAKSLSDRPSFEVICESPDFWNHRNSNKAYGYTGFHYNTDSDARDKNIGRDLAMFDRAIEVIDTIRKPFYGMLITMTMHGPFKDPNIPHVDWIWEEEGLSDMVSNYLQSCNYFDTCLEQFITLLKQRNIYDNSVIVIASDHSAGVEDIKSDKIVLAILGAGIDKHISHPIGQVDVFPTILQVMNRYNPEEYSGMGLSVFNPSLKGAVNKSGKIVGNETDSLFREMLKISQLSANTYLRGNRLPQ